MFVVLASIPWLVSVWTCLLCNFDLICGKSDHYRRGLWPLLWTWVMWALVYQKNEKLTLRTDVTHHLKNSCVMNFKQFVKHAGQDHFYAELLFASKKTQATGGSLFLRVMPALKLTKSKLVLWYKHLLGKLWPICRLKSHSKDQWAD